MLTKTENCSATAPQLQVANKGDAVRSPERISAIDMTKGVLVVAMVVYHSFNYSANFRLGFRYLPFLPPSFILITGFLIAKVYDSRRHRVRAGATTRLIGRGLRLLTVFTLLNIGALLTGRQDVAGPTETANFFSHWKDVYLTGVGRFAAFEVLVPIAYLILAAPLLLFFRRSNRFILFVLTILLFAGCEWLSREGRPYGILLLFSAGVVGMVLGDVSAGTLELAARNWIILALIYAGFVAARPYIEGDVLAQLIDALLATTLIFAVCFRVGSKGFVQERLIVLGKYSLIAYVAQIAVLQLLVFAFGRLIPFSAAFFCQMVGVLGAILLMAEVIQLLRRKFQTLDFIYRISFA